MTSEEANKKTCPFTLHWYCGKSEGGECIGDICMAWQYANTIPKTMENNPKSGYCARLMVVRNR